MNHRSSPAEIVADNLGDLFCAHCHLPIRKGEEIHGQLHGEDLVFCCNGCRAIHEFIHLDGLQSFYRRRNGWTAGAPLVHEVDLDLLQQNVSMDQGTARLEFSVSGIRCASCVWLIERSLKKLKGVQTISVNYANHKAVITWDSSVLELKDIVKRIQRYGYTPRPYDGSLREEGEFRALLLRFGTASFFAMQLMTYSFALYAGYFHGMNPSLRFAMKIIAGLLATPVIFYSGSPFIRGALKALGSFRFTMDSLIAMGALSAYFLSIFQTFTNGEVYYDTAVMIITLILLGRLIEAGAKARASEALQQFAALAPDKVRLVVEEQANSRTMMIPAASIKVGQLFSILPGERVPIDGVVVEGRSEIDESMLSGESKPVKKEKDDLVLGGTMNHFGHLLVKVQSDHDKTVLAQIIRSVEDAQARRAPVQAFADHLVGYFVPGVMVLALVALVLTVQNQPVSTGVIVAVSVLIVACPCSLGLATPLALLVGTGIGARKGILIKGGDVLEQAHRINVVVLDKTGTLTTGIMTLVEVIPLSPKFEKNDCIALAASLEKQSEHAVARAICTAAKGFNLKKVEDVVVVPGKGIEGNISGETYRVGSLRFMEEFGFAENTSLPSETDHLTRVYLAGDEGLIACFVISDQLREGAREMVSSLQHLGIEVAIVSGDQEGTVSDVARACDITNYRSEFLPAEKVKFIEDLKIEQGFRVAMVGDGINDAPALMTADVGIAVAKGTDIAMESADIVLLRDDLGLISKSLQLSRQTFKTIKINLVWALGYNMIVLPAALFGFLHPILCAGAMTASSLCVVGNSLLLRKRGGL